MDTKLQEKPPYKSETYYAVVVGDGEYLGWKCVYAGVGAMRFRHSDGRQHQLQGGPGPDWMAKCWDAFVDLAATQIAEGE